MVSRATTATSMTALANAAFQVDATYTLPHLAYVPMEPNNAACRMREDGVLDVWIGTETPEYVKMNASAIAGIDKEKVEVHVTFAGGSFGLHSQPPTTTPCHEAVQIAQALDWKHPIRVQSLREEEFKVGRYRAMAVHRVRREPTATAASPHGISRSWPNRRR